MFVAHVGSIVEVTRLFAFYRTRTPFPFFIRITARLGAFSYGAVILLHPSLKFLVGSFPKKAFKLSVIFTQITVNGSVLQGRCVETQKSHGFSPFLRSEFRVGF